MRCEEKAVRGAWCSQPRSLSARHLGGVRVAGEPLVAQTHAALQAHPRVLRVLVDALLREVCVCVFMCVCVCVCVCGRGKGLVEGVCVTGQGRGTWSTRRLGSGEMTVRPEKSTRLPLRLPRNRPCLPLSRWHKPRTACGVVRVR